MERARGEQQVRAGDRSIARVRRADGERDAAIASPRHAPCRGVEEHLHLVFAQDPRDLLSDVGVLARQQLSAAQYDRDVAAEPAEQLVR